jgi:hypothetical protein
MLDKANLASSLTIPQPTWTYFNNNYDAGAGNNRPRYCKDAFGFVHIQGNPVNGTGADITTSVTLFTLPVGFRPEVSASSNTQAHRFPMFYAAGTSSPSSTLTWVNIQYNGTVVMNIPSAGTGAYWAMTQRAWFGNIMFFAEN